MKIHCYGTGICEQCGKIMSPHGRMCPAKFQAAATRRPRLVVKPHGCRHLGEPTSESTLLYGTGCDSQKRNGVQRTIYVCELHKFCLPSFAGTHVQHEAVQLCATCPDKPAAPAPP